MNGYIEAGYVVGIGGTAAYWALLWARLRRAEAFVSRRGGEAARGGRPGPADPSRAEAEA